MNTIFELFKDLVNTGYLFMFFLSLTNIIRHIVVYYFDVIAPAEPKLFKMEQRDKFYLIVSFAIMLTCIFTGFKLI